MNGYLKLVSIASCFLLLLFTGGQVLGDDQIRAHIVEKGDGTITIFDSAGRTVEIPYPITSAVTLWDNPAEEMIALGAGDRIVGIEITAKADADNGIYPSLVDVPVVGSYDEPDYEKIVELDPDVVIMLSSYPPLPDEVAAKLAPFDIPVVALDFYRVEVWTDEIRTLGAMLGKEDRAEEFISLVNDPQAMITERISAIPDNQKSTVYFEGSKDYQTYGGSGYGAGVPGLIHAAGAYDLFPDREEVAFDADPEEVAIQNPDVIIKGTNLGFLETDSTQFRDLYNSVAGREELAQTDAVQNGKVWVMSFDVAGGARKKFGPMYLAKILYPDLFTDFSPDDVYQTYLSDYLGITPQGTTLYPAFA